MMGEGVGGRLGGSLVNRVTRIRWQRTGPTTTTPPNKTAHVHHVPPLHNPLHPGPKQTHPTTTHVAQHCGDLAASATYFERTSFANVTESVITKVSPSAPQLHRGAVVSTIV